MAIFLYYTRYSWHRKISSIGEVFNINLYLFSWAAVICCFQILSACYGLHSTSDVSSKVLRRFLWFLILKISLVLIVSADHIWSSIDEFCENENHDSSSCFRTSLALKIGMASLIVSLIGVITNLLSGENSEKLEWCAGIASFILSSTGIIFITSTNGPGETIGNLFFFSWLNLGVSSMNLTKAFWEENSSRKSDDNIEMIQSTEHFA